jgi:hypothetical protein
MVWVNEEIKLLNEKVQALNINTPNRIIIFFIFSLWLLQAEALIRLFGTWPVSRLRAEALQIVYSQWLYMEML